MDIAFLTLGNKNIDIPSLRTYINALVLVTVIIERALNQKINFISVEVIT